MEKLEGKIINKSVHDRKRNRSFMVFSLNSFILHVWYLHFCRYLNVLLYIFFPVFYPPPHVYVILHHDTHCSFLFFVFSFTFSCLIFILLFFSILFWFVKICFFICIFFTSNFSFFNYPQFFHLSPDIQSTFNRQPLYSNLCTSVLYFAIINYYY